MANGWSALNGWTMSDGDTLPLSVLLHSRTVVESQTSVATGLMTHVEGEWFEVELGEYDSFQLGETVKLTIYSPAGIQTFHSSVFAKYEGAIAVIQPPGIKKRYVEKRSHPRVEVKGSLQIISGLDPSGHMLHITHPPEAALRNISLTGVGFDAPDLPIMQLHAKLQARVEVGFGFNCELEIVRREQREEGLEIGAVMALSEPDMMRAVRALILQRQVADKVQMRKEKGDGKRKSYQQS